MDYRRQPARQVCRHGNAAHWPDHPSTGNVAFAAVPAVIPGFGKANAEKLGSGDLARVNEVVYDPERQQREHGLTAGEEQMLQKARDLRQRLSGG